MLGDRRLQLLAVAHVALGVVTSVLAHVELSTPFGLEHILMVPFVALALCQALLLSLWGAASQARLWIRLAGLVAGAVYLEALVASDLRREFLGTSTITIVVTTATLLVMRWLGVRLTRQDDPGQSARQEPEGLRFSIRGMMIFTAAVAVLCAGARALQESPNRLSCSYSSGRCVSLVWGWSPCGRCSGTPTPCGEVRWCSSSRLCSGPSSPSPQMPTRMGGSTSS